MSGRLTILFAAPKPRVLATLSSLFSSETCGKSVNGPQKESRIGNTYGEYLGRWGRCFLDFSLCARRILNLCNGLQTRRTTRNRFRSLTDTLLEMR